MQLNELIKPNTMIARSINLERDINDEKTLNRYFLTNKGVEIIKRFAAGLNGDPTSAWSITGPYGMGKSAFVNFLLSLCGPASDHKTRQARLMLAELDDNLRQTFESSLKKNRCKGRGFLRVAATSSFEPINRTLARGLLRALKQDDNNASDGKALSKITDELSDFLDEDLLDSQKLINFFQSAETAFGAPIAIVIDEFGKNLEYLSRFPGKGDLFILQTIAEMKDIYLWVCLHQAFEEYATGLTGRQRQEWSKVQGRFEDIVFIEPPEQMLRFISDSLIRANENKELAREIKSWGQFYYHEAQKRGLTEIAALGAETLGSFFPLHPLAAICLPELCAKFAQNDRTLFAFLCGGEPNALPSFLSSKAVVSNTHELPVYGPEMLYDYFIASVNGISMARPESSRWIEVRNMVERGRDLPGVQRAILKVIGLLNLISGTQSYKASAERVAYALSSPTSKRDLSESLSDLSLKGMLIYREYADEYRLWEGSDFDIRDAIQKQRLIVSSQSLEKALEQIIPLIPLTAARHSYKTGTLRHFERQWTTEQKLAETEDYDISKDADGLILYCLGKERLSFAPPDKTQQGKPILVAHAPYEEQVHNLVIDAAAANSILDSSPELQRDGVARKEAKFRAKASESRLWRLLSDIFKPGNTEVSWHYGYDQHIVATDRNLSELISGLCDDTYAKSPFIRNELINRNRLSSAAARARRELIEAMVTNGSKPKLNIDGTGPEVAIYRTMLLAETFHVENEDRAWQFEAPKGSSSYFEAWQAIAEKVEKSTEDPLPINDLISLLKAPPFGMKEGPIPILIVLYILVEAEEVTIYKEGSFIPYLSVPDLELMVKRPEYFAIKRFSQLGIRGKIFMVYQELLSTSPVTSSNQLRNKTMLNIVGPLVQFAKNLPDYVKRTRTLSAEARNVLRVLLSAKDPIQLLFSDLPHAVGMASFDEEATDKETAQEFQKRFRSAIVELSQKYTQLIEEIKYIIKESFHTQKDIPSLREELKERAYPLAQRCSDQKLKPFIGTLATDKGQDESWLTSIATIVSQQPVDSWTDHDINAFSSQLHDIVNRFMALETIVAAEKRVPPGDKNKEPRLISIARPDGRLEREIIWVRKTDEDRLKTTVKELRDKFSDEMELKSLFALLGDYLFNDSE